MINLLLLATVMSMPTPEPYMDLCRHDRMNQSLEGVYCEGFEGSLYCATLLPFPDPNQCVVWEQLDDGNWKILVIFRAFDCREKTLEDDEEFEEENPRQEASERGDGKRMGESDSYAGGQDTEA